MFADKTISVAFSGHRQLAAGDDDLFAPRLTAAEYREHLRRNLVETIVDLIEQGYCNFLCGMAVGFDLLAGEAVAALKTEHPQVRLIAVIPFPGQADRFGQEDRQTYERVLAAADHSLYTSEAYGFDCYHRRNDYLVDNSSVLVCFYNGSKGGTAYTVKRAIKSGLRVVNLYDM